MTARFRQQRLHISIFIRQKEKGFFLKNHILQFTYYYFISIALYCQIYTTRVEFSNFTQYIMLAFYNINIAKMSSQIFLAFKIKYPFFFPTVSTDPNNSFNFSTAEGAPCFFWITTHSSPLGARCSKLCSKIS